jgi:dipeptidyl-peptidase-3
MKKRIMLPITVLLLQGTVHSQTKPMPTKESVKQAAIALDKARPFQYVSEQFADLRILRYQIPGFETLNLKQK